MGKHSHVLHKTAEQHVKERGTYCVGITFKVKGDPYNADRFSLKFWPGTKDGFDPPQTLAQALECAERIISVTLRSYPADYIEVGEVRITTFEQGGPADDLTEKSPLLDLADDVAAGHADLADIQQRLLQAASWSLLVAVKIDYYPKEKEA